MSHTWAIFWSFSLSWLTAENNVCEIPIVFRHAVFDFVRIDKFFTFRPFLTVIFSLSTNLVAGFRWHIRRSNTSVLSVKGFLIVLELISSNEWYPKWMGKDLGIWFNGSERDWAVISIKMNICWKYLKKSFVGNSSLIEPTKPTQFKKRPTTNPIPHWCNIYKQFIDQILEY